MTTAARLATPTGLVGAEPRKGVGVAVTVGRRGPGGTPELKDRFWFMSPTPHSQKFGGTSYQTRDPHPGFVAWNMGAEVIRKRTAGGAIGRFATLKGNIIHEKLREALLWNRAAQKLSAPHPNPKSQRPACEGDGVRAIRFEGEVDGEERYGEIPCPNTECVFAMSGLCKPSVHLIFRLRWNPADEFEAQFQALRAKWTSHSWNSLRNVLGMFESVLGTEAVAPWKAREEWTAGLAAELGIAHPSLIGMPFSMTIGSRTRPPDAKSPQGRLYPVVTFSEDGDLVEWLLAQRIKFQALGGVTPIALPEPSVTDGEFLEIERHADSVEAYGIVEAAPPAQESAPAEAPRPAAPVPVPLEAEHGETPSAALGAAVPSSKAPPWPSISATDYEALAARLAAVARTEDALMQEAGQDPAVGLPHAPIESLGALRTVLLRWERDAKRGKR